LPFAINVLHVETTISRRLDPANTSARMLLASALDQETGVRGYLVTPEPAFLQPHESGRRLEGVAIRRLEALPLDGDERDALQETIDDLHRWQREYVDPELALIQGGDLDAARSAEATKRGKALFDNFRASQTRFVALIEQHLAQERNQLHLYSMLAIAALIATSAIAVVSAVLFRNWARASVEREDKRLLERAAFSEVHELASVLAEPPTTEEIATLAAREAARLLGASDVHVWTVGDKGRLYLAGTTDTHAASGTTPSVLATTDRNAPADAARGDRALYFGDRDAFESAYPEWSSLLDVQEADAVAVVPTRSDRRPVGTIEVFYSDPKVFDDGQRTLLELTADQIGNALARARTRERENEAAATLQASLLGPPVLVAGVGHSTRYLPAEAALRIGGDWHNIQQLADGRIMIAVGDVVGRGIDAATVMGQLRAAVSACALRCADPAELLEAVDEFALQIPGAMSTTIAIAFVDLARQQFHYVCAGHPPPVLVSPDGHARVLEDAVTWPLAIGTPGRPRVGGTVAFPAGSSVILYSDGLIERRDYTLDAGIERLVRAVESHWRMPLDALADAVVTDLLDGQRRHDDIALLALRSQVAAPDVFLMKTSVGPDALGRVRERLRAWLDEQALSPDDQLAVLIAVGEACANTIQHAYGAAANATNLFRVEACREGDEILCCVTDNGAWKDSPTGTARGNGLAIMRELMDQVVVDRRPSGTAVTLRFRCGVRAPAPQPSPTN
jgi:serine phosphatase RsbU (regulator of sigma subunit)/CHASE3 domain sensor protein/anti-sigma regulatory factor (Ser/Thr protein kinase)